MATAMVTDARDDASEAHRARTISKTRADPKFSALAHALGEEGTCTLRCASPIVVGAGLVGSETARLLTLCGVREIVLVDDADHAVTADDVAANIILRHRDVGERRVHAVAEALTSERNKVAGDVSITPISDPARAAFHRADAIIFSRDADPSTPSDPRLVDALASADDAPVVDARSAGLPRGVFRRDPRRARGRAYARRRPSAPRHARVSPATATHSWRRCATPPRTAFPPATASSFRTSSVSTV